MIYASSAGPCDIKVFAEDSIALTSNMCSYGSIFPTTPFFADCSAYSADTWVIEVQPGYGDTESVTFSSLAILVPLCSMLTKAELT